MQMLKEKNSFLCLKYANMLKNNDFVLRSQERERKRYGRKKKCDLLDLNVE